MAQIINPSLGSRNNATAYSFALALPLSEQTYTTTYASYSDLISTLVLSDNLSARSLSRSLPPLTEGNVVLDRSSFVGEGLWVVPGSVFCFLSYGISISALDLTLERSYMPTIDGDAVI